MDKILVDMMRSTFNSRLKPERFINIINELYHKEHMRLALIHNSKGRSPNTYFVDN